MVDIGLKPVEPYSFVATTRRLVRSEKALYRVRDGQFLRVLRIQGRPIPVEIGWESGQVRVQTTVELGTREREILARLIRRMFSLDVDLGPFYEHMKKEYPLAPIIEERKGLHFVLDPSLYECLIKTVISQQLNLSFAGRLVYRLVELAGETIRYGDEELPVFPTPEQVARLDYEDLQKLQFNRRKAEYVIDLSRQVADGELDLEGLQSLSDRQVVEKLVALRGVGRWTAECLLLFGMGRPDLLPAADIGVRNAVKKAFELDGQPTEAEVREWGEGWTPWRSYVTFYLWDYLTEG